MYQSSTEYYAYIIIIICVLEILILATGLLKGCLGFVSDRQSTLIGEVFWCLVMALSGLRFVDRELPLTTMVSLCASILCVLSFWFF